jgi:hypothetical protein
MRATINMKSREGMRVKGVLKTIDLLRANKGVKSNNEVRVVPKIYHSLHAIMMRAKGILKTRPSMCASQHQFLNQSKIALIFSFF